MRGKPRAVSEPREFGEFTPKAEELIPPSAQKPNPLGYQFCVLRLPFHALQSSSEFSLPSRQSILTEAGREGAPGCSATDIERAEGAGKPLALTPGFALQA